MLQYFSDVDATTAAAAAATTTVQQLAQRQRSNMTPAGRKVVYRESRPAHCW